MTETLANGYSSESTQRELSNEYQHDSVLMIFRNVCVLVLWANVVSALEGLTISCLLTSMVPNNSPSGLSRKNELATHIF